MAFSGTIEELLQESFGRGYGTPKERRQQEDMIRAILPALKALKKNWPPKEWDAQEEPK